MSKRPPILLAALAITLALFSAYHLALAGDDDPVGHMNMHGLGDSPCLIVFELGGSDGVERTVLVDAEIVDLDGKPFLNGTVTDDYPTFKVISPGTGAFVALDRITYIQYLAPAHTANGG